MAEFTQQLPGAPVPPMQQSEQKAMPDVFGAFADLGRQAANLISDRRTERRQQEELLNKRRVSEGLDETARVIFDYYTGNVGGESVVNSPEYQAQAQEIEQIAGTAQTGEMRPVARAVLLNQRIAQIMDEYPEARSEIMTDLVSKGVDKILFREAYAEQALYEGTLATQINLRNKALETYATSSIPIRNEETGEITNIPPDMSISVEQQIALGLERLQADANLVRAQQEAETAKALLEAGTAEAIEFRRRASANLRLGHIAHANSRLTPVLNQLTNLANQAESAEDYGDVRAQAGQMIASMRTYAAESVSAMRVEEALEDDITAVENQYNTIINTIEEIFTGDLSQAANRVALLDDLRVQNQLNLAEAVPMFFALESALGKDGLANLVAAQNMDIVRQVVGDYSSWLRGIPSDAGRQAANLFNETQQLRLGEFSLPDINPENLSRALTITRVGAEGSMVALSGGVVDPSDQTFLDYSYQTIALGIFASELSPQTITNNNAEEIIDFFARPMNEIALQTVMGKEQFNAQGSMALKMQLNAVERAHAAMRFISDRDTRQGAGLEIVFNKETDRYEVNDLRPERERVRAARRGGTQGGNVSLREFEKRAEYLNRSIDFMSDNMPLEDLPEQLQDTKGVRVYLATRNADDLMFNVPEEAPAQVQTRVTFNDALETLRTDFEAATARPASVSIFMDNTYNVIDQKENGGTRDYRTLFGNSHLDEFSDVNVLDMTIGELFQWGRGDYGDYVKRVRGTEELATPIGRYQIVGNTMMFAAEALGLDPSTTKFSPQVQDAMAEFLIIDGLENYQNRYHHWGLNPDGSPK